MTHPISGQVQCSLVGRGQQRSLGTCPLGCVLAVPPPQPWGSVGPGVVTPAAWPAAGTPDTWCTRCAAASSLGLFQALCAPAPLLFWGRPLIVLEVVCFCISCSLSCPDALLLVILGTERPTSSPPEAVVFGLLLAPLSARAHPQWLMRKWCAGHIWEIGLEIHLSAA